MYDPAGQRVWKKDGRVYLLRGGGQPAGDLLAGGYNVYFGKKLIYNSTAAVVTDRLGSVVEEGPLDTTRYFPYGDEPTTTEQNRPKFATYYRDGSTALDYAQQRYYASTLGRFTSPGPLPSLRRPRRPPELEPLRLRPKRPSESNDPSGLRATRQAV